MEQLKIILSETLSPYADTRKNAELQLEQAQKTPGFPLEILKLIANVDNTCNEAIRQAAAVNFKNTMKKGWDINREDGNDGIIISDVDRNTIKTHLVQLMCTVPKHIQVQLSEAISIIAIIDFPQNWQNLLPELVHRFTSTDVTIVIGVLTTANSIFKSFRYVERSDELYTKIKITLEAIQVPLLALFTSITQAIQASSSTPPQPNYYNFTGNPKELELLFTAMRLLCRIVYSLNCQDLPEFFEDHMNEYMAGYAYYLEYNNPILNTSDDDDEDATEPNVADKTKVAVIEMLSLYTNKDEECFMEYLPNFTKLVWNLLMNVTTFPKHDMLATRSINFLSSLISKGMHKGLFANEGTLRDIIVKIVIPNLTIRSSDIESFEDDPKEYISTEIEGSDSESRRKCSHDLLKNMGRHFDNETTQICSEHITTLLQQYHQNQQQQSSSWIAKDAAIHLMMGIAIKRESSQGVSEVNAAVNVMDFFQSQILPELTDTDHSNRPVLKATSIKFVNAFRKQFSKSELVIIMPMLIAHLSSPVIVVHTFAAYAIERILITKEELTTGARVAKFGASELKPFLEPLFSGLFAIIDNQANNENDFAMKCIMGSLVAAKEDIVPVASIVITKLTETLARISKNPQNPQFNHYLFESIAVLVRSVCSHDPMATITFEPLLFVPFNTILQLDIVEFTPYVFQILAQLLEYRPAGSGLGDAYSQLFPPLLTPALWDKRGNVPALSRLFLAYIDKAAVDLVPKLTPILGVFQKLLSSKVTEVSAFEILNSAIAHFPPSAMEPVLPTLFQLLLVRLQSGKTPKYTRLVTSFFALFIGKYGVQAFLDRTNSIQPGMANMLVLHVWSRRLLDDPPVQRIDAKINVIGATKLLCESPEMFNEYQAWQGLFLGIANVLTSNALKVIRDDRTTNNDDGEIEVAYDAQFSRLIHAKKTIEDPFPEIVDPTLMSLQLMQQYSASHHPQVYERMRSTTEVNSKLFYGLQSLCVQSEIQFL